MASVYDAAGGEKTMLALAHAWHARCLEDDVVAHAFTHYPLHPEHTSRLAAYWAEQLGGPRTFTEKLGSESQVVGMHAGNGPHPDMDARALDCFAGALEDVDIADERVRTTLLAWFAWALEQMSAYPDSASDVPPDLTMKRWSWTGPVSEQGA